MRTSHCCILTIAQYSSETKHKYFINHQWHNQVIHPAANHTTHAYRNQLRVIPGLNRFTHQQVTRQCHSLTMHKHPVSHPYYAQAPQPGYPTAPPMGYPPVSQPNYIPVAATPAATPQPSYNAITNPLPVLGPQYCLPHLVDLEVTRKLVTLTDDFVVTDVNNNVMFKVKGKFFSLHDKRVLLDSTGKPVVTLRHKILTAHSRWLMYRGDSSDSKDLLFTAKTSSVIQLKTKLNVYLANRTSEDVCDFKVQGSWSERSCVIYVGESTTIAAQMHMNETAQSNFLGKDTFMITIYPNVDYAFIVSLIVILDAINTYR